MADVQLTRWKLAAKASCSFDGTGVNEPSRITSIAIVTLDQLTSLNWGREAWVLQIVEQRGIMAG